MAHHFYEQNYISKNEKFLFKQLKFLKYILEKKHVSHGSICESYSKTQQSRLTLIDSKGTVICDSMADAQKMDNHLTRPEIRDAFLNTLGSSIRYSKTIKSELMYGTLKIVINNKQFVIRQAVAIDEFSQIFGKIKKRIYLVLLPILIVLSFGSIFLMNYFESKKERNLNKMKKDLFYNIAHEVKTPLTSIKGYIQVIGLHHKDLNPQIVSLLKRVEGNSQRLAALFDGILDLASLEGDDKTSKDTINLKQFTEDCVENIKVMYSKKNMHYDLKVEVEELFIDYQLLEHIFVNLVENAVKYSNSNSKIVISWFLKNQRPCLEVKDFGEGIEIENQEKIFDRFYRVDTSRSCGVLGTGLGLSIVKHAAIKAGAKVELISTIGVGSSFTVVFMS